VQHNRGKQSICLDLKKPPAADLIRDLISKVDVLVQNYAPGVIGRLGFDYQVVNEINPRASTQPTSKTPRPSRRVRVVEMNCPVCGADNPSGHKFCNECAAPFEKRCAKCGYGNAPTAKFCGECAASLEVIDGLRLVLICR
jgi:hypothetical protein